MNCHIHQRGYHVLEPEDGKMTTLHFQWKPCRAAGRGGNNTNEQLHRVLRMDIWQIENGMKREPETKEIVVKAWECIAKDPVQQIFQPSYAWC